MNPKLKNQKSKLARLIPLLLSWFNENARDLPWRRTRDPYAIWVSEIMLQQTQVKTVIPFWTAWMSELPTIQSLADAPSEKIHKLWEGLGYYTRVRNMRKAAREIVERHRGQFPERFDDVLALPGIGRYTAGAVCSIAFNQPTPILDGNVIRVLTRVFGIAKNPHEKETNAQLWKIAEQLVSCPNAEASRDISLSSVQWRRGPGRGGAHRTSDVSRAPLTAALSPLILRGEREKFRAPNSCSHLNQSLMELGALICTPRQPKCESCPIKKLCLAFRENRVGELPNLGKREKPTARRFAAFVVEHGRKFLVRQRPAGVVNAHLWEFPNVELNGETDLRAVAKFALGFRPAKLQPLCTIKHSITRYRISLEAFTATANGASIPNGTSHRWLKLSALDKLSFPSAHRELLTRIAALSN